MSKYSQELKFTKEHEWLKTEGAVFRVGITDYAAEQLGDVVHVELPRVGDEFSAGEAFGVVESVKSVSDMYLPVTGRIEEVNEMLFDHPGLVNEDPFGEGWIVKIAASNLSEINNLMSAETYQALLTEES